MYRAYENPRNLESRIQKLKTREYKLRQMLRERTSYSTLEEVYEDLVQVHQEIEELEQRTNHAWQDGYEEA